MRCAIAGARFAERDAAARASLDEVARRAALDAPRSSAIAAALDLLRGGPDRVVANHARSFIDAFGLRDPAWGRALDARKGDALIACAECLIWYLCRGSFISFRCREDRGGLGRGPDWF